MRKGFSSKFNLPVSTLGPGEYYAANQAEIIGTLVGSCIAVCLFDEKTRIGGMNHFMLPGVVSPEDILLNEIGRYGLFAMELLIGEIIKKGGDRKTLKAKCFGGGQVLNFRHSDGNIPDSNIRFVRKFFELENIPLIKEDVGGSWARKIYLFIPEGRILLKRLPSLPQEVIQGEGKYKSRLFQRRVEPPSLTLF